VIGPMARTVSDLQLLFDVLAGNANSATAKIPDSRLRLRGLRVAYYTDDSVATVTEETRAAVEMAAKVLSEAGLNVAKTLPPGVNQGHDLWLKLFSRASVVQLRNVYAGHEDKGGDFVRWRLATADDSPPPSLDAYIQSWLERDRLRHELIEWMENTPLLVAPVGATAAYEHGTYKLTVGEQTMNTFRAFSYSQTFNVFDLPAVCVPVGTSRSGLPIGVQIAGQPFQERMILAVAGILEGAFGGMADGRNRI